MISISVIAKMVGVCPSTVSRALNNKKGVSDALRKKIIGICNEHGYQPNDIARGLITKHSGLIGLVIPDIISTYYSAIAKGVSDCLMEHNLKVLLCSSSRDAEKEKKCVDLLLRHQVEGIVLVSITAGEDLVNRVLAAGVELVSVDNIISPKCTSIVNDNYSGAKALFNHMAECGCRNIGWIGGNEDLFTTKERMRALMDTVAEGKINIAEGNVIYDESTFSSGYKHAASLIDKGIDAIFGVNDTVALGAMKYCLDNKISVPRDIRIAGYDDLEIGTMLSVPLTTVHQRKIKLGENAAHAIISALSSHNGPIKITLDPWLVKRESCGEKMI